MNRQAKIKRTLMPLPIILAGILICFTLVSLRFVAAEPEQTISETNSGSKEGGPAQIAPFWLIYPLDDGSGFDIAATKIDSEVPDVHFNIIGIEQSEIGPSNYEHSYTPTYSDTLQGYVVNAVGLSPQTEFNGTINMTSTADIQTNDVELIRYYVESPILVPETVVSTDGLFRLTLGNANTLAGTDTYITLVVNDIPPGPPALNHRLLSRNYTVLQDKSNLFSQEPMFLRLYYSDLLLNGADPFMLAIFYWDQNTEQWVEEDGSLFDDQRYVALATERFATYALQVTNRWADDFDDFDGLGEFSNVTLGTDALEEQLILRNNETSGFAISRLITPSVELETWGVIEFESSADSATSITVDVLSQDGSVLLSNVSTGSSLSDIDPEQYPSIKIRINLTSTTPGETPSVDSLRVTWGALEQQINQYLPLILNQ